MMATEDWQSQLSNLEAMSMDMNNFGNGTGSSPAPQQQQFSLEAFQQQFMQQHQQQASLDLQSIQQQQASMIAAGMSQEEILRATQMQIQAQFSSTAAGNMLLDPKFAGMRRFPFWKQKTEEDVKAKKEKRRMHNRVSAKLARERKKNFIATLETQLMTLQQSVFQLETMKTMLAQENGRLRTELAVVQRQC